MTPLKKSGAGAELTRAKETASRPQDEGTEKRHVDSSKDVESEAHKVWGVVILEVCQRTWVAEVALTTYGRVALLVVDPRANKKFVELHVAPNNATGAR